jgi:hypothetical protein
VYNPVRPGDIYGYAAAGHGGGDARTHLARLSVQRGRRGIRDEHVNPTALGRNGLGARVGSRARGADADGGSNIQVLEPARLDVDVDRVVDVAAGVRGDRPVHESHAAGLQALRAARVLLAGRLIRRKRAVDSGTCGCYGRIGRLLTSPVTQRDTDFEPVVLAAGF